MRQLEARFRDWDRNNDHQLDKEELARAFRGKDARPFDQTKITVLVPQPPPPRIANAITPRPTAYYLAMVTFPKQGMPIQLALSDICLRTQVAQKAAQDAQPTSLPPKIEQVGLNPNVLPDFQFLRLVSKNDNKITHQEFQNWARRYAELLDHYDDLEDEIREDEAQIRKAKEKKAKQKHQQELSKHQYEFSRVSAQISNVPPAIRKALNVRP